MKAINFGIQFLKVFKKMNILRSDRERLLYFDGNEVVFKYCLHVFQNMPNIINVNATVDIPVISETWMAEEAVYDDAYGGTVNELSIDRSDNHSDNGHVSPVNPCLPVNCHYLQLAVSLHCYSTTISCHTCKMHPAII